uniref:Uncharacterized protein n=1 Tax=Pseudo-nitzschia australis TaxID=44445 RepID=A0A7S4ALR7_9STRA|mmetsp:Transcript_17879/g.37413  ORF Transcript_17879/g.37413 Transcript_17879/m.37413 type:complete len:170 (+) Transcript_17879:366-875(+)
MYGCMDGCMFDYINEILNGLPDDVCGTAATPGQPHLFKVDETNTDKLDTETADLFHHYTAQLLFLSKGAGPNIQTAVAFLCTRVREPDIDDYKKLQLGGLGGGWLYTRAVVWIIVAVILTCYRLLATYPTRSCPSSVPISIVVRIDTLDRVSPGHCFAFDDTPAGMVQY